MTDFMSPQQRSRAMSSVRGKETGIERSVRSLLHRQGFRFKKNVRDLPGRPDILLPKYNAAIFIHGCFWHGHSGCRRSTVPATRTEFWQAKIGRTTERDKQKTEALLATGWRVAVIWQCSLKGPDLILPTVDTLADWIRSGRSWIEIPSSS
jgi:DNA mismatch endonuclease (patch repair protein)